MDALKKYTDAINLKVETKNNAVYYSNRAYINLKLENYGSAIEDANMAIKIDPNFVKAYHRRALAYLKLNKYTEGLKDLQFLKQKFPEDKTLDTQIEKAKNDRKRFYFYKAYSSK